MGGRCQEMVLQFLINTFENKCNELALLAAGTDGQDGPTSAAGCVYFSGDVAPFDSLVLEKAKKHLKNHDSYNFWIKNMPHCLINTNEPTGVNVMDIYCMIKIKTCPMTNDK